MMHPARYFRFAISGVIAGIVVASFFSSLWSFSPFFFFSAACVVFFISFLENAQRMTKRSWLIFAAFFLFGIARFLFAFPVVFGDMEQWRGGAEATVLSFSTLRYGKSEAVVARPDSPRIRVHGSGAHLRAGDRVTVTCSPQPLLSRDGTFDFFWAERRVFFSCDADRLQLVEPYHPSLFFSFAESFISRTRQMILRYIPEPEAGIARAMFLGERDAVDGSVRTQFRRAGLVHMLVISGMHMVFLSVFLDYLFLLFFSFSLRRRLLVVLSILFLYLVLLGFPLSATRGFLFVFTAYAARFLGRVRALEHTFMGTAALILLVNPFAVRSVGLLLSFLATAGVLVLGPRIDQACMYWFRRMSHSYFPFWAARTMARRQSHSFLQSVLVYIRQTTAMSLGAIFLTAPFVLFQFETFSLVGVFANILVAWVFVWVFGGVFLLFVASVLHPIAVTLSPLFIAPLRYLYGVASYVSAWRFSEISFTISEELVWIVYIIFFFVVWTSFQRRNRVLWI